MSLSPLRQARLIVSADALLTVREAGRLLGFRGAAEWIARHVPVRNPAGHQRVRWGDVLDACPPESAEAPTPRRARARVRLADV